MNLQIEIFQSHSIAEITIKPVRLLHQHDATILILRAKAHDLREILPSRIFRGFDINKFFSPAQIHSVKHIHAATVPSLCRQHTRFADCMSAGLEP